MDNANIDANGLPDWDPTEDPDTEDPDDYLDEYPETGVSDEDFLYLEVMSLMTQAEELVDLGRQREALAPLLEAHALAPNDISILDLLARLYHDLEDYTAALRYADLAIEVAPARYLGHYWRSSALRKLGDNAAALAAAKAAVRVAPGVQYSLYMLALMQQLCGQPEAARRTAQRLVETAPRWDGSYYRLAWVCMEQERWIEAAENYRKTVDIKPDFVIALNNLGYVYERLGRKRNAIETYGRALATDPTSDYPRTRLAELTTAEGFDSVAEFLRLRTSPTLWAYIDRRTALLRRAREALENNTPAEAIRVLNTALPTYSRDVPFLDLLAAAYFAEKTLPSALHYAAIAVVEAPDDWRGHLRRGQILVRMSEEATGEAATRLRKDGIASALHAVDLAGDNRWALSRLVSLQHECNMLHEAEQTAQKLLRIAPKWADSYYYVAIVYHARGLLLLAETYYRKALELDPDDAGVYSDLGRALWDRKRRQEAVECFRRAAELEPDDPYYEHNFKLSQARLKGNLAVNFYVLSRIRDYKLFTES